MEENKKEKQKTAVALEYIPGETAPQIVATGKGHVADKMIEVAKETDVPVHKDEKLAGTLSKLEIGDYIPQELYGVVAEILVMVDRAESKMPKKRG
ncbi:MAG: EscU/YscU/HrcU family type III secretion system export apparatus switch protein [Lachnospiraceae bacterium]|nr:EscU/YscU/HrcU family type III secretion system export apparatus switch protein [Lachnospiraceae bacterium]